MTRSSKYLISMVALGTLWGKTAQAEPSSPGATGPGATGSTAPASASPSLSSGQVGGPEPSGSLTDAQLERMAERHAHRPFDLSRDPMLRLALVRTRDEEHVLLLTMHHIATDGWSIEVLVHEVQALYGAFTAGRPSPLPELPIQYVDFAAWQRMWIDGQVLSAEVDFWRRQLAELR